MEKHTTRESDIEAKLERDLTVKPVPDGFKVDAGLRVDAAGGNLKDANVKLDKDGHTVLLPQPTDDPNDPLNWSWGKKHTILLISAYAAVVSDVTVTVGPAVIFQQAQEWDVSPSDANLAKALGVLMGGVGGLIWVPMANYWGRAPVVFWSYIFGFGLVLGGALSPNYASHMVFRTLQALFLTCGQTMGTAFIKDMFFFHERAKKVGLWALLYITSPYLGPCLSNFVIHGTGNWPDVFWLSLGFVGLQLIVNFLWLDETYYDRYRHGHEQPDRPAGFLPRMARLTGLWQIQHSNYFPTVYESYRRLISVVMKPAFVLVAINYAMCFAWAIGINIDASILFKQSISAGGYGFSSKGLGTLYLTPIVAIFLGEAFGHYANDWLAAQYVRKHNGFFKPEVRLWMIQLGAFLMTPSLILLGFTLEQRLNVAGAVFGWGIHTFGLMLMSVANIAYSLDAYPTVPAEVGGWLNFARTTGGFSVGFFHEALADRTGGYDGSFGVQAAVTAASAIPIIIIQIWGPKLRAKFGEVTVR